MIFVYVIFQMGPKKKQKSGVSTSTGRKRLASSRSRSRARSPTPLPDEPYDAHRFRSLYHEQRFHNNLMRRQFVREKGFRLEANEYTEIQAKIRRRGWKDLVATPGNGCKILAREFYANAYLQEPKPAIV